MVEKNPPKLYTCIVGVTSLDPDDIQKQKAKLLGINSVIFERYADPRVFSVTYFTRGANHNDVFSRLLPGSFIVPGSGTTYEARDADDPTDPAVLALHQMFGNIRPSV